MEAFYFYFFLLPLIVVVAVLGASVYYITKRKQKARKRTKKLIQSYFIEKDNGHKVMNKELAKLQRLLDNESIDRETYVRLKKVLVTMHEKDRAEVEDLIEYVKNQE